MTPLALVLIGLVSQACSQGTITSQPAGEALTESTSSSSGGGLASSSSSSSGGGGSSGTGTTSSSSSSGGSSGASGASGIENMIWTSPCIAGSVEPVNPDAPPNYCNPTINPGNYSNNADCEEFNITVTEEFSNSGSANQGIFTLTETRYADQECSTALEQQVYSGNYTLSQSSAVAGAWNVNYTSQQATISLDSSTYVTDYNDIQACGSTSWAINQATPVEGTSCSTVATLFTTAEVVGGSLYVSNFTSTDPGESSATRPTDLSDSGAYVVYTPE
jgi:hypothetical protein